MEDLPVCRRPAHASRKKPGRAIMAAGFWLQVAFVGASLLAAGAVELVDGGLRPFTALTLSLGGGVLAAIGWWLARGQLGVADAFANDLDGSSAFVAASSAHEAAFASRRSDVRMAAGA